MWSKLRGQVYFLLFSSRGIAKFVDSFIIMLIAVNVVMVILETEQEAAEQYAAMFHGFDIFSSLFFTVEYVLRVWTCVEDPRYRRALTGRLRYSATPMAVIDLVAILPFWLPMFIQMDLRFVRALRLFRLFRLFKIGRYATAISALARVFGRKKEQLAMTFFTVSMMLILFSSIMYFVEHEAQPDKFGSIVETMWWTAATLTTVGYGDVYPITGLGQMLGGLISFMGVIIIALPAGIVASGFAEEMDDKRREAAAAAVGDGAGPGQLACPHCGKGLHLDLSAGAPDGGER